MPLKQAVFRAAQTSGFGALVGRSPWRTARLAILCYHGVSIDDEHEALPELYVTQAHLRRRFEHLREGGFAVLPLAEALGRLAAGDLPPRSVALTFDDGTRDFASRAVPLLQEYALPATVYVTTYYSDHPWPVFNTAMRYMLWRGRRAGVDLSDLLGPQAGPQRCAIPADGGPMVSRWVEAAGPSAAEKQRVLERAAERVGIDMDAFHAKGQFCIMTPPQIGALPRPLVDVQLHTHRHRTPRDALSFAREIDDNRASLRRSTGDRPLAHFCYPSGDYARAFLPWLAGAGIASATTCVPGLASARSDRLLLPRFIDTSLTPEVTFQAWLDGTADLLPRKRAFRLDARRS